MADQSSPSSFFLSSVLESNFVSAGRGSGREVLMGLGVILLKIRERSFSERSTAAATGSAAEVGKGRAKEGVFSAGFSTATRSTLDSRLSLNIRRLVGSGKPEAITVIFISPFLILV